MLSKPFVETLSVKDMPSNRYLFRLVPSERRTEGIEFGLLPTVQTQGLKRCNSQGQRGGRCERFNGLDGFSRIAADPYGKRQKYGNDQRTERWSEPDERFKTQYSSSIWEKFPTQSPICSGDDGLSGRLDGITFSKWRQESVKAYGNAIVPQVSYEIFKTIELCR